MAEQQGHHGASIAPHEIFSLDVPGIGDVPVTNTLFSSWLAMGVLLIVAYLATRRMSLVPSGLQNVVEAIIEQFLRMAEQTAGPKRGRRFLPLVATSFLFILVANWMGILPGYAEGQTPWLRSANSDLNITAAMAIVVFFWVQVSAIRAMGVVHYLKEFLVPLPLLHLFTELGKPVSLALRLFGNIFAGEILIGMMSSLVPFVIPAVFLLFEMFVGVVQALIFAMLTMAFLTIVTEHEHEHEERAHGHAEASHG